jgi:hypothetical protein
MSLGYWGTLGYLVSVLCTINLWECDFTSLIIIELVRMCDLITGLTASQATGFMTGLTAGLTARLTTGLTLV